MGQENWELRRIHNEQFTMVHGGRISKPVRKWPGSTKGVECNVIRPDNRTFGRMLLEDYAILSCYEAVKAMLLRTTTPAQDVSPQAGMGHDGQAAAEVIATDVPALSTPAISAPGPSGHTPATVGGGSGSEAKLHRENDDDWRGAAELAATDMPTLSAPVIPAPGHIEGTPANAGDGSSPEANSRGENATSRRRHRQQNPTSHAAAAPRIAPPVEASRTSLIYFTRPTMWRAKYSGCSTRSWCCSRRPTACKRRMSSLSPKR